MTNEQAALKAIEMHVQATRPCECHMIDWQCDPCQARSTIERQNAKVVQGDGDQPIVVTEDGTVRFRENKIVRFLLDNAPFDINDLSKHDFGTRDWEIFMQLIGYSVCGYGELSCVSSASVERADEIADAL